MESPNTATVSSGSRMAGTSFDDELLLDLFDPPPSGGAVPPPVLPGAVLGLGSTNAGYVGCSGEVGVPPGGGGGACRVGKKGGAGAGGVWDDGGVDDWSGTKGWCSCLLAVAGTTAPLTEHEASRIGTTSSKNRRRYGILTEELRQGWWNQQEREL